MIDDNQRKQAEQRLQRAGVRPQDTVYIEQYHGQVIVIKFGGSAMVDGDLMQAFADDVVLLKRCGVHPVIVHGGGPQIDEFLRRLSIEPHFIDGLRVTDRETLEVVEMVLSGKINKSIVSAIQSAGGYGLGISGKDCGLLRAVPISCGVDLGFVGEPSEVDIYLLNQVVYSEVIIPVIAPLALGPDGNTYNVNADTAAGALAVELGAERLLLLTDVPGVLDGGGNLLSQLSLSECRDLFADGTVRGGMIPKVETCMRAVGSGVKGSVIVDGREAHCILLETFTRQGLGTLISGE